MVAETTAGNIRLDITNNWTGHDELPFEPIAERTLEIAAEEQGQQHAGAFTITFAKPVEIPNLGWACVFRMSAMGRTHVSPARGIDAVDALQQAFALVHKQLTGMSRMHTITFHGSTDLGFATADTNTAPKGQGCPVMNGTL